MAISGGKLTLARSRTWLVRRIPRCQAHALTYPASRQPVVLHACAHPQWLGMPTLIRTEDYSPDSYNKNWLFYSDYLWGQRWDQILQLKPQFLEIITWNGAYPAGYRPSIEAEQAHQTLASRTISVSSATLPLIAADVPFQARCTPTSRACTLAGKPAPFSGSLGAQDRRRRDARSDQPTLSMPHDGFRDVAAAYIAAYKAGASSPTISVRRATPRSSPSH